MHSTNRFKSLLKLVLVLAVLLAAAYFAPLYSVTATDTCGHGTVRQALIKGDTPARMRAKAYQLDNQASTTTCTGQGGSVEYVLYLI